MASTYAGEDSDNSDLRQRHEQEKESERGEQRAGWLAEEREGREVGEDAEEKAEGRGDVGCQRERETRQDRHGQAISSPRTPRFWRDDPPLSPGDGGQSVADKHGACSGKLYKLQSPQLVNRPVTISSAAAAA